MSKTLDEQKARNAYRTFVTRLRAGHTQAPVVIPVSRGAMLNAFLNQEPEYKGFRDRLAEMYGEQDEFPVNPTLWNEVVGPRR